MLRIGTRASALAMVQARLVADGLALVGVTARLEQIVTEGDRRSPDTPWGEGAFVTAIEQGLLDGSVDLAVHSAKDVPTDEDPRLRIAAYLERGAPEDVLVLPDGRQLGSLDDLPRGARVGTDSPRRTAFLRACRPDLVVHPLHGNVDTRLRRLDAGETDALVLARAGLMRLGRPDRISLVVPTEVMPPAPGQGALAVQVRSDDTATAELVARLDDAATRRAVTAERRLLAASGGGCRAPLGALARVTGEGLSVHAGYATSDGAIVAHGSAVSVTETGDAAAILAALEGVADAAVATANALGWPRVIVTRARAGSAATRLALVDRGLAPVSVPTIAIEPEPEAVLDEVVRSISDSDWVVISSVNAVDALVAAAARADVDLGAMAGPRWAAVGPSVSRALRAAGVVVTIRPSSATSAALAEAIPLTRGARVLIPRGDLADGALPDRLVTLGAIVRSVVVYRTVEAPPTSRVAMAAALRGGPAAVLASSGSTVRGWLRLATAIGQVAGARHIPVVAIGPSTASAARDLGLSVIAVASSPESGVVAETAADAIRALQESA